MLAIPPAQSSIKNQPSRETFSEVVNRLLANQTNGIKNAAELALQSNLSKVTISRICRNSNDKGASYRPTPSVVIAICVAFSLDSAATKKLFDTVFPEQPLWRLILDQHMNIVQANEFLYDNNCPLLGNAKEN